MTNPQDQAYPLLAIHQQSGDTFIETGLTKREVMAKDFMIGLLAGRKDSVRKPDDLIPMAVVAVEAADILIEKLNQHLENHR